MSVHGRESIILEYEDLLLSSQQSDIAGTSSSVSFSVIVS